MISASRRRRRRETGGAALARPAAASPVDVAEPAAIVDAAGLGRGVVGRRGVVKQLVVNVLRRPKVNAKVGDAIDVRALMHIGPTTEPTPEEVRLAADMVMGRLIALVAELRNETAPHPHGVERVDNGT